MEHWHLALVIVASHELLSFVFNGGDGVLMESVRMADLRAHIFGPHLRTPLRVRMQIDSLNLSE